MLGKRSIHRILGSAIREGNLGKVSAILDNYYGPSNSLECSQGYNLLCEAFSSRHVAIAKLLLTRGCKVNSDIPNNNNTPLHYAASVDDTEIMKMILDKGGVVNARNHLRQTPLHIAIEAKHVVATDLLLKYGANVNATTLDNISLLHIAAKTGCVQVVELLLKHGASLDCLCTTMWNKGYTPLFFAVVEGKKAIVKLLLKRGATVNFKAEDDITSLHLAAKKGFTSIAKYLLHHGASIDSLTKNQGYTPLYVACENGQSGIIKLLIDKDANIHHRTKNNMTPLLIATKKGHEAVVRLILENGAEVDDLDNNGKTALYIAVDQQFLTIIDHILKYCPDINIKSNKDSVKIAVQGFGESYLILNTLLEYGLVINPYEANNAELLHEAIRKGYIKIVEDLLKFGADVNNLETLINNGFTPLHTATKHKQREIVKLLIRYNAKINVLDRTGRTPLYYAIKNFDSNITKLLLTNSFNLKDWPEQLYCSAEKDCTEIIESLLQHKADINFPDKVGRTLMHYTALGARTFDGFSNNVEVARLLLSRGANIDAETMQGATTLHIAIEKGFDRLIAVLLEHEANVNICTYGGVTPLHLTAQTGNVELTQILLHKGANINAQQNTGVTPLHIAAGIGHTHVVEMLAEYGAKIDCKTGNAVTALHFAAMKGHVKVIETILKHGANIHCTDYCGKTPLHIASQEGHSGAVMCLLNNGCDVNKKCFFNRTAIECAFAFFEDAKCIDADLNVSSSYFATIEFLKNHLMKLRAANMYLCRKNFIFLSVTSDKNNFQYECEDEVESLISELITPDISFYDVLTNSASLSVSLTRNENAIQVLNSDYFKQKFPIYYNVIENHFRRAMEMKELFDDANTAFQLLTYELPVLPYDCIEKIFSYLSVKHLRNLKYACKYY